MRAYKFLDEKFGLKSIEARRLKQSRIADLNDPFELLPLDLTDVATRNASHKTLSEVNEHRGMLCLSANWTNPVIWAHYSNKHKGLCLGFDIPDAGADPANDEIGAIQYVNERLRLPADFLTLPDENRFVWVRSILFTKFDSWQYEQEVRIYGPLGAPDGGNHFVPFDKDLQLKEVIVGLKCPLSRQQIEVALGPLSGQILIKKARASYDKFEVVEDEDDPG